MSAYWLGWSPNTFYRIYTAEAFVLFTLRWALYRIKKWHYYLFDFCYVANVLLLIHLWVFPHSAYLHKVNPQISKPFHMLNALMLPNSISISAQRLDSPTQVTVCACKPALASLCTFAIQLFPLTTISTSLSSSARSQIGSCQVQHWSLDACLGQLSCALYLALPVPDTGHPISTF